MMREKRFNLAKKIADRLVEGNLIDKKKIDIVRGIIQIIMEE